MINLIQSNMNNRDVHDQIKVNTNTTCELETWTNIIETKLEATSKTAKDYSGEITNIKKEVKIEMDQLWAELHRRPAQMMIYPTLLEDSVKLTFAGNKWENPMEFLVNCEKEMEQIGNNINDTEKINFVTRHFKDSAAQWYTCLLYTSRCV